MGARVALLSGGKDSLYAAAKHWPPDVGLVLVYRFPEPSPHLVNLGATIETLTLTGVPVVVARLPQGREFEETVRVLRLLGAGEIVAGDVFVEDHLRYMERVAAEAGAKLREPLWGMDTLELLYEIAEYGIEPVVIGVRGMPRSLLGTRLVGPAVDRLVEEARRLGADPLGENGEYHTLVVNSPLHREPLEVRTLRSLRVGGVDLLVVAASSTGYRLIPGAPL